MLRATILAQLCCLLAAGAPFDKELRGGRRNNPGLQVRLLEEGLFYIHEVGPLNSEENGAQG